MSDKYSIFSDFLEHSLYIVYAIKSNFTSGALLMTETTIKYSGTIIVALLTLLVGGGIPFSYVMYNKVEKIESLEVRLASAEEKSEKANGDLIRLNSNSENIKDNIKDIKDGLKTINTDIKSLNSKLDRVILESK